MRRSPSTTISMRLFASIGSPSCTNPTNRPAPVCVRRTAIILRRQELAAQPHAVIEIQRVIVRGARDRRGQHECRDRFLTFIRRRDRHAGGERASPIGSLGRRFAKNKIGRPAPRWAAKPRKQHHLPGAEIAGCGSPSIVMSIPQIVVLPKSIQTGPASRHQSTMRPRRSSRGPPSFPARCLVEARVDVPSNHGR